MWNTIKKYVVKKKQFSIPLYENGKKTKHTINFKEGDVKWKTLMNIHNEIPSIININLEK